MINGFGAMLEDDAAEELAAVPEVKAVTLNAAADTGTGTDGATTSGGTCAARSRTRPRVAANCYGAARATWDVSPLNSLWRLRQPLLYVGARRPTRGSAAPPATAWAWQ